MISARSVLNQLVCAAPDALIVSTCGLISRDLHSLGDRPQNLYVIGSMGAALPIALGISLAKPDRRVIAVDGDGSFLMNLGAAAMVGSVRPANLTHVLLDNGVHESTGGQRTANLVHMPELMRAATYRHVVVINAPDDITSTLLHRAGPTGLYASVSRRSDPMPVRVAPTPIELAARTRALLQMTSHPQERT